MPCETSTHGGAANIIAVLGAVATAAFLVVRALLSAWVHLAEAWVPKWLYVVLAFFPVAFIAGYHSATAEQGAAYASLARDVLARERASDFDQRESPGVVPQQKGFRRVRSNGDLRRRAGGFPRSSSGSNLRARFRRHQRDLRARYPRALTDKHWPVGAWNHPMRHVRSRRVGRTSCSTAIESKRTSDPASGRIS